jgi:hypothetical protein
MVAMVTPALKRSYAMIFTADSSRLVDHYDPLTDLTAQLTDWEVGL